MRDWTDLLHGRAIIDNARMQEIEKLAAGLPDGEVWECGVYRGGSALALRELFPCRVLRLFDTFTGMPEPLAGKDLHAKGDFANTSLGEVALLLRGDSFTQLHAGQWPDTFFGLERSQIAFLHLDGDLYRSVWSALAYVYPRMVDGGVIVNDDYGLATCPGAKEAMDAFFADKPETVHVLPTAQAYIRKGAR